MIEQARFVLGSGVPLGWDSVAQKCAIRLDILFIYAHLTVCSVLDTPLWRTSVSTLSLKVHYDRCEISLSLLSLYDSCEECNPLSLFLSHPTLSAAKDCISSSSHLNATTPPCSRGSVQACVTHDLFKSHYFGASTSVPNR